jgi:threonine dehydratase/serine racemase
MLARADVDAAAERIAPFIVHTPVLRSPALDAWMGATVFVKAEHRQHTGAFKFRGATNAVQSLSETDAARGVAAHSSGNHAAALACAARERGLPAYVVMPEASSPVKIAAVQSYGARITFCANSLQARRIALAEVLDETGALEIHPFENPRVIAGAGTAALELTAEVRDLDVVVTPVGGGGLCSGTCLAVAPLRVLAGSPLDRSATIADGLRTGTSEITQSILDAHAVDIMAVPEAAIVAAVRAVDEHLGATIEPSAAVAFAAARAFDLDGARVGIICSGRNVSAA